jgi:hypothetical protein
MRLLIPIFVVLLTFQACKKSEPREWATRKDYSEAYKYFPTKNHNQWWYNYQMTDSAGNVLQDLEQRSVYSADSNCINNYYGQQLFSMMYWKNTYNKMGCCGDRVLINYDLLDCNGDSTMIYKKLDSLNNDVTYQFCKRSYPTHIEEYKTIPCVKTKQTTIYKDNSYRLIISYFGYEVGLIYYEQTIYSKFGNVLSKEVMQLKSHQF